MRRFLILLLILVIITDGKAQSKVLVPFHTAYATGWNAHKINRPSARKDALLWSDTATQLRFFVHNSKTGALHIALNAVSLRTAKQLTVEVRGKKMNITVPINTLTKEIKIGTVQLTDTGFVELVLSSKKLLPGALGIGNLVLSGPASEGLRFNTKERLNAASVHLRYPLADSIKAIGFYNEITIPQGYDPLYSYYMATGFSRGYFGIQVNSEKERRVIFSVWDAGNEAVDRGKVADSNKVKLLAKGDAVVTNDFGNEGTGGHSHWVYN